MPTEAKHDNDGIVTGTDEFVSAQKTSFGIHSVGFAGTPTNTTLRCRVDVLIHTRFTNTHRKAYCPWKLIDSKNICVK